MRFTPTHLSLMGMAFVLAGTVVADPELKKWCFFIGTFPLLATAYWIKHKLFISLEWVILLGVSLAFVPLPIAIKAALPIALGAALVIHLIKKGHLQGLNDWVGTIHLLVLAIGYAVTTPSVYLAGGLLGMVFASLEWRRKVPTSWVWFCLNTLFCASILYHFWVG